MIIQWKSALYGKQQKYYTGLDVIFFGYSAIAGPSLQRTILIFDIIIKTCEYITNNAETFKYLEANGGIEEYTKLDTIVRPLL